MIKGKGVQMVKLANKVELVKEVILVLKVQTVPLELVVKRVKLVKWVQLVLVALVVKEVILVQLVRED